MKRCACGELVDDAVRFHWLGVENGHYVDDPKVAPAEGPSLPAREIPGNCRDLPENTGDRRESPANAGSPRERCFGDPPQLAPPPGDRPRKPWGLEEDLRYAGLDYLRTIGYTAHDLEQGNRPGGGHTRVSRGLPDAYVQGHGVRAWVEFKRWDRDPTPDQLAFMAGELEAGGIYLLVYEVAQLVAWHSTVLRRNQQGG